MWEQQYNRIREFVDRFDDSLHNSDIVYIYIVSYSVYSVVSRYIDYIVIV